MERERGGGGDEERGVLLTILRLRLTNQWNKQMVFGVRPPVRTSDAGLFGSSFVASEPPRRRLPRERKKKLSFNSGTDLCCACSGFLPIVTYLSIGPQNSALQQQVPLTSIEWVDEERGRGVLSRLCPGKAMLGFNTQRVRDSELIKPPA